MNQKEYELLGGVVARTRMALELRDNDKAKQNQRRTAISLLVTDLAATLQHEYPKTFDRSKFLKSCGLEEV